jgi:hypothetical protein
MRKLVLLLIAVAAGGLILFAALRGPATGIVSARRPASAGTPVKARVRAGRGVSTFKVDLVKAIWYRTCRAGYEAPAWAFWRTGATSARSP